LMILILSAFMHATWNLLSKKSKGGTVFVWFYLGISIIFMTPFLFLMQDFTLNIFGWLIILASVLTHAIYSISLQYAYKIGDMGLIYPTARGTGPFIVMIFAVVFYNESITLFSGMGILLVILSIFILNDGFANIKTKKSKTPLFFGVFIGLIIAIYTLIDKAAVSYILISPFVYFYFMMVGQFIFISLFIINRSNQFLSELKNTCKYAIGVGVLNPLAYILVLFVMTFTQVSYVAPVREV